MARSVWKGPFVDGYLLKKAEAVRSSGRNEIIRTWSRRSTIMPQFVGLTFGVYNGQKFLPVLVTENMVGHNFGEFSPTRTFSAHPAVKNANRREANGQAQERAKPGRERGSCCRQDAADQPPEAEPGGRHDPWPERREGAC